MRVSIPKEAECAIILAAFFPEGGWSEWRTRIRKLTQRPLQTDASNIDLTAGHFAVTAPYLGETVQQFADRIERDVEEFLGSVKIFPDHRLEVEITIDPEGLLVDSPANHCYLTDHIRAEVERSLRNGSLVIVREN